MLQNRIIRLGYLSLAVLAWMVAVGCDSNSSGHDPLQIRSEAWESLSVQYSVGTGPQVTLGDWSTSDKAMLARLQKALVIVESKPLSLIGTMDTNSLRLRLCNGGVIDMYILDDTRISMHDPERPKASYSLVIDKGFVRTLRNAISADSDEEPRFYYTEEVTVVEEPM